jgi:hypothetical protein
MLRSLLAILFLVFASVSSAQMDKTNIRAMKKIDRLSRREKFENAEIRMRSVLNKYPVSLNLWDIYIRITYEDYIQKLTKKNASDINTKNALFDHYNAIYYANMSVPFNSRASSMLRELYVDKIYYSRKNLNAQSLELFEKATLEMSAQNYQLAIDLYEKSYFLDSNNYSALIGLGKSHAKMEYYGKAIQYYNQAKQVQPMINESNTLLASALLKKGESSLALKVCKNSLLVYPEESIFSMMYSILDKQNKQLQRNWVLRLAPINNVDDYYHRGQLFNDQLHFIYYRNALETAKEYYDLNGLLKEGVTLPISQYLEVYCWEKMLEATEGKDVPALSYARYIYNKGLLEPYVLINLFNVDLYAQFHHFVENKENVALDFINQHLISNGF